MPDAQPQIAWDEVKSSNIAAIARGSDGVYVRFNSGAEWFYPGVGDSLWAAFQGAESKGKFFAENIKPYGGQRL